MIDLKKCVHVLKQWRCQKRIVVIILKNADKILSLSLKLKNMLLGGKTSLKKS